MDDVPNLPAARFVVGELLGEGAAARVFRAWHVDAGQWCAVKVLRRGVKDKALRRFLAEGALQCRLQHRNLLHGWELGEGPPPFLVMDLAEGGSLKGWLDRHGAMGPRLAVDVAIQICKGVATAHHDRVVHRDIKPHNVLIARKGVCKVTDFGIAQFRQSDRPIDEDTTSADDAMGTMGYMSPEQQGDPANVDVRSDVYGIGATLFHLLKGRTPPSGLFAVEEYPETFEGIHELLLPIVKKCTAYRPEDRYATVQELARALHDTWEYLPAPAPGPTLMTDIPPELPPPHGHVSATPSTAPRAHLPPGVERPSLEDQATPASVSLPSVTDPSDFRRALVSQNHDEEPVEVERTRWAVVVPSVLLLLAVLGVLDVAWVLRSQAGTDAAVRDFLSLARRELAVVDELDQLGADGEALLASYERVRNAEGLVARAEAADAWLVALRLAEGRTANSPDPRTLAVVGRRIEGLEGARRQWQESEERWRGRADSLPGRLATLTGWAVRPPERRTGEGGR